MATKYQAVVNTIVISDHSIRPNELKAMSAEVENAIWTILKKFDMDGFAGITQCDVEQTELVVPDPDSDSERSE